MTLPDEIFEDPAPVAEPTTTPDETAPATMPATVTEPAPAQHTITREQVDLIRRTVAKECNDDELRLFLHTAQRIGLDPLLHQIHAVKRKGVMTVQVGIDGLRLVADRTGRYAPGPITVELGKDGMPVSATAIVRKLVAGVWHDIPATAYWEEYAQVYDGKLGRMWAKMPKLMIGKCAEALALRRAFPAELSNVYATEEMMQAENAAPPHAAIPQSPEVQTQENGSLPWPESRPQFEGVSCPKCGRKVWPSRFTPGQFYCNKNKGGCGWQGFPTTATTPGLGRSKNPAPIAEVVDDGAPESAAGPTAKPTTVQKPEAPPAAPQDSDEPDGEMIQRLQALLLDEALSDAEVKRLNDAARKHYTRARYQAVIGIAEDLIAKKRESGFPKT